MHDKLKTFKANKSNRRLICYFLWNKEQGPLEQRPEGQRRIPALCSQNPYSKNNYNERTPDIN